jgi:hypothetical protein
MRSSSKRPLLGVYVGLAGVLVACQSGVDESGVDESREKERGRIGTQHQKLDEPVDTVETYAAKCDAATGIHVPAFSCTNQPINQETNAAWAVVDESSKADNAEAMIVFGSPTAPSRTAIAGSATAFTLTAGGFGTVEPVSVAGQPLPSDQFYFAETALGRTDSFDTNSVSRAYLVEATLTDLTASSCAQPGCVPQAGVMVRASTEPTAPFAMLSRQADGKLVFKRRQSDGGPTTKVFEATGYTLPLRLRLQWDGQLSLIAEVARAGQDWERFGPTSTLPDSITPNSGGNIGGVAVAAATAKYDALYTPRKCDRPNALNGACQPESTFQVVERTADAVVVANCRKSATFPNQEFDDIAVIQYNRINGAVCFYQSPAVAIDASLVPAPSRGSHYGMGPNGCENPNNTNTGCWTSPQSTHDVGCTGCHDSTALIRSPYIKNTGLLPDYGFKSREGAALRFVGHAFADDRSFLVGLPPTNPATACTGCHNLAVNNVETVQGQGGTAYRFATMATTPYQYQDPTRPFDPLFETKNTVSPTSPTWMPPGGLTTYPATFSPSNQGTWPDELKWASTFRNCAKQFWDIGQSEGWDPAPDVVGCNFTPFGTSFAPALGVRNAIETNIGTGTGGSAVGDFDAFTITSPVGSDVYGTADKAYTVSAILSGDGYLVTKVTSLTATNEYAKAGLMFRESNDANAKNVMLSLTAQHGLQVHYRSTTGATTTVQAAPTGISPTQSYPLWLRLERAGNTVFGSMSTDERNTWQRVGEPVTFSSFAATTQSVVGTSSNANQLGTATFASLDFTPTDGWMGAEDLHVLSDLHYGASVGKRKEWITEERMSSKGGDIYNATDNALFSFKSFSGNGELETVVKKFAPQSRYGKAGLMIRAAGTTNAANVFFGRIRDGLTFQSRATAGGSTTAYNCESIPNLPARLMLRLVRNGTTFTAFYKADDATTTWTQMKNCSTNTNLSLSLPGFATSALAGLAVSSETGTATTTATLWSGKTLQPPGFLWSAPGSSPNVTEADPTPDPQPPSTGHPCDGFCTGATTLNYSGSYQSNNLGTGARCMETVTATSGGLCGNMSSRVLKVNGTTMSCNNASWSPIPPKANGGYCVQVTAGTPDYAWFSIYQ